MGPADRVAAMYRNHLTLYQCLAWAARHPEQVPTLNAQKTQHLECDPRTARMICSPVAWVGARSFSSRVSTELAKPRCATLVHRQEGLDREACRRHLQRRPEGGDYREETDLAEGGP